MKKLKVELVEDWRECLRWSTTRIAAILSAIYLTLPHIVPLLADHWPDIAPWVMHFFPSAPASIVPVVGMLLMMAARITNIRRGGDQ
ncbi:hypothetical protein [Paraburkholderia domus]|uniref:DUF7940 domain-containing protein n=1 Tax=Paraburkholderia domus TaxID=2793075 RepID=UPI0019137C97|nr:hypothetical protein [Paraburkholderia domus]MBK5058885.1 hypothetical protein [Burkholderia sp. R-70199]CAE6879792.1 hypothetical protein R70199_02455 [Paraburkholderia domus]